LLRISGVTKSGNPQNTGQVPIFQSVFGPDWEQLPPVMRAHYAVRPFSRDRVVVSGTLDIEVSRFMRVMSRLTGMLVSRSGKNVPVTVTFTSGENSADFHFERVFHYPEGDQHFRSRMTPVGGNELVEYMRFGVGWKMACRWDGEKVLLSHRGYVWRIFGLVLPLPLGLIIGAGEAEERPLSDDEFHMWTHAQHPWFGKSFAYAGVFRVTEVSCPETS